MGTQPIKEVIALDTETTGIDSWHGSMPFIVTLCNEDAEIQWWEWAVNPTTRRPKVKRSDVKEIQECIAGKDLVFHNANFDIRMLSRAGVEIDWQRVHDTTLTCHLLNSSKPKDLTAACLDYLEIDLDKYEKAIKNSISKARRWAKKHQPTWMIAHRDLPSMPSAKETVWKMDMWLAKAIWKRTGEEEHKDWYDQVVAYSLADPQATIMLFNKHKQLLEEKGLWKFYEKRREVLRISYDMEESGITLSEKRLDELTNQYKEESGKCARVCINIAKDYNFELELPKSGNNKSLTEFVFDHLELPIVKTSPKTGLPSMDKTVLSHWKETLPARSKQLTFVNSLLAKRSRDTAVNYMESYRRFMLPLGDEWYVIHPSLNPTGTNTLRWSSKNPNEQNICVDADTEFLTDTGWIKANELTRDHVLAQYWKETGEIEFTTEGEVHKKLHKGQMCHITTEQQIDMMLTPEHRCLVQDRKTKKKKVVKAKDFPKWSHHLHAGEYLGGNKRLTEAQVVWLCAVQADAGYHKTNKKEYGIRISLRKSRKIKRLKWALSTLGVVYKEKVKDRTTCFMFGKHHQLTAWTKALMPNKMFDSWLLEYDRETLDLFCEEVFFWDGGSNRKRMYSSSEKQNADWAQILFTVSNSRAWIRSYTPTSGWAKRTHHCVNVTRGRIASGTGNHTNTKVPWNGYVYCVTVPSSFVVTRRNGRVSITGNSKKEGFNLRYVYGPAPDREWWSLDYDNLELRIPAYECQEPAMLELFERPDRPPYYGSYHLLIFSILYPEKFRKYGHEVKNVYKSSLYQWTKNGNFAELYGAVDTGDGKSTADRAFHYPGAQAIVAKKLKKKSGLNKYWINCAKQHGYVETMPDRTVDPKCGYPLYPPKTWGGKISPTVPLNYHVQGTACWVIMQAMIKVEKYLQSFPGYNLVMQIHDELVFDFPKKDKQGNLPIIQEVKKLMESCGDDIGVPLTCGVDYHPRNWSESDDYGSAV